MAPLVRLEIPNELHEARFLRAVHRSADLHRGWVNPPANPAAFRQLVERAESPSFFSHLLLNEADELLGVVNVSEIVRGCFQSAYLGYYAFSPHNRRGNLRAGLKLVLQRAFGQYALHRVEANIIPGNAPSIQLVRGLGFRLEGLSVDYLKIAGRWQDHERWALTIDNFERQL